MIEAALYEHLQGQASLSPYLALYAGKPAIFNQEAPSDMDTLWGDGPQYGRIVFAEDIEGDPERTMGGTLAVDIMCKEGQQTPEEIEPLLRQAIHGYFFSNGKFTVAAQFKNSSYFTQPTDKVIGCTLTFDLLGFPLMTTCDPDVIDRLNAWTNEKFSHLHVINHEPLPKTAWKPEGQESAVYWRLISDQQAGWIPDTYQTIWRTANVRGHIFSETRVTAGAAARAIITQLYTDKRLFKDGESPIMVNRSNSLAPGADPLRTGQLTIEATYAIIVYFANGTPLEHINLEQQPIERGDDTGEDGT